MLAKRNKKHVGFHSDLPFIVAWLLGCFYWVFLFVLFFNDIGKYNVVIFKLKPEKTFQLVGYGPGSSASKLYSRSPRLNHWSHLSPLRPSSRLYTLQV